MITAGKYTYHLQNLKIKQWDDSANLIIGKFCSIAGNVSIYLGGGAHNTNWITTYPFGHIYKDIFNKHNGEGHPKPVRDVIIGNDVWIGGDSTIMSGVRIGDGSVIASNSHVVKNVEPYSIVGGNPAKLIKYRFGSWETANLLRLKWWDLPDEQINELSPFLCSSNIDGFFKEIKRLKGE